MHKKIVQEGFVHIEDFNNDIDDIISKMVAHDFWYFQVEKQQITANSESIRSAMKKMV